MSGTLDVLLAAALLLFASVYLGTGWSLVLFQYPLAKTLTPETYRVPMVEPVKNATSFFTWWTCAMLAVAGVLAFRAGDDRWMPIAYLVLTVAATLTTVLILFPFNKEMREGVTDPERLKVILRGWMRSNFLRTSLWTGQWLVVTAWFVLELT